MLAQALFEGGLSDAITFLGRFHAVLLHFPIGFLVLVFILEIYAFVKPSDELRKVIGFVLGLGAFGAVGVAILGFILAREGGYDEHTLNLHRILGFVVVFLAILASLAHRRGFRVSPSRSRQRAYRGVITLTVIILMAAGHYGGNLTHGSQYLVEYAPPFVKEIMGESDAPAPAVAAGDLTEGQKLYLNHIEPLFKSKCVQCHGGDKQKGGYRLDQPELVMQAGDSETPPIVPNDPFQSNLVRLILLPHDHDDVMPPEGKTPLTSDEALAITHWIQNGAEMPVSSQADSEPKVAPVVIAVTEEAPAPIIEEQPKAPKESFAAIDFAKDIQPILEQKCVSCHSAEKSKGGLRLDTRELALAGGETFGPAIVPGIPEKSPIYVQVSISPDDDPDDLIMPPAKKGALAPLEIDRIREWVKQGAAWPEGVKLTAKELQKLSSN